ncbi:uncharacterized protein LOC128256900 [Drosophila gunungcola]|uniref:Uncharacterized protein n=1 Tax=Drosophila gunungcola TaxID=103775 RepID=A0A9Q0BKQ0_9MUSC|nr:uncharacterized protein LOC128256900 [Drosophila gunungcola]KAI8035752.1 hypothetical protein M5D96_011502 [Drosophila gunungcola]
MATKLGLRRGPIQRLLANSRWYNWGNYDASSGECCRMRDKETVDCLQDKLPCPHREVENKCYERPSIGKEQYPKYLQEIYQRGKTDPNCLLKLIRHDNEHYKPSDKYRQYQRTWSECPLLWLRPKDSCCPDPEAYPPMKRRIRPPQQPPLSAIEKHLLQMNVFCKSVLRSPGCRLGLRPPTCHKVRQPTDCCKREAPMPSFSEACCHLIPRFCRSECACQVVPGMCDMWNAFHRRHKSRSICTKPLMRHSSNRSRMRYPF